MCKLLGNSCRGHWVNLKLLRNYLRNFSELCFVECNRNKCVSHVLVIFTQINYYMKIFFKLFYKYIKNNLCH